MDTRGGQYGPDDLKDVSERAAFQLVPQFIGLGVTAEPYDRYGRRGVVDFLLHYPEGRTAALEVTSDAADDMRQLYALLSNKYQTLPNPGMWTWSATVRSPRDLPELAERSGRIILLCESVGLSEPQYEDHELDDDPDIAWLIASTAELHGSPDRPKLLDGRERPLYVTLGGEGGILNASLDGFAQAVEELLARPHIQRRIAKLAKSGFDERHLFVHLDHSALPFDLFDTLATTDVAPHSVPALPGVLTHLWLMIDFVPWVFLITDSSISRFSRVHPEGH